MIRSVAYDSPIPLEKKNFQKENNIKQIDLKIVAKQN